MAIVVALAVTVLCAMSLWPYLGAVALLVAAMAGAITAVPLASYAELVRLLVELLVPDGL